MPSDRQTVGEQHSVFNVRALCITPNPFYRQGVQYCIRKHREEPNRHPPTTFQSNDPNVVV